MDLVTDRLFRHMAWANAYVFDCLSELSESELLLTAPHDDWTAGSILEHLTGAGYADALDGLGYPKTDVPKNSTEVLALKEVSATFDARLRDAAKTPDGLTSHPVGSKQIYRSRQTILAQAIHHATEHRAQIAGIFAGHGMKIVDLDEIDLWAFANYEGLGD